MWFRVTAFRAFEGPYAKMFSLRRRRLNLAFETQPDSGFHG